MEKVRNNVTSDNKPSLKPFKKGRIEGSDLLEYDAVSLGQHFPSFRRNYILSKRREIYSDTVVHSRRSEAPTPSLWVGRNVKEKFLVFRLSCASTSPTVVRGG
jgi:hypothetical protein